MKLDILQFFLSIHQFVRMDRSSATSMMQAFNGLLSFGTHYSHHFFKKETKMRPFGTASKIAPLGMG